MRTTLLVAAAGALAVLGGTAWLLLGGGPAPLPQGPPPVPDADGEAPPPPPPPAPKVKAPPPAPKAPLTEEERLRRMGPDAVPDRPPGPMPERGIGEVPMKDVPREDMEKVETLRRTVNEKILPPFDYRNRSLKSVLKDLSDRAGVKLETAAEDLDTEPVLLEGQELPLRDVLMKISEQRHLSFEIRPDRIVFSR